MADQSWLDLLAQGSPGNSESLRAQTAQRAPRFTSALEALADLVSGGARGVARTSLGWPGDLERLLAAQVPEVVEGYRAGAPLGWNLRGAGEALGRTEHAPTILPNSEDLGRWLPGATQFSIPAGQNPMETIAGNAFLTPRQVASAVKGTTKGGLGLLQDLAGGPSMGSRAAQRGAVRAKGGNFDVAHPDVYLGGTLGAEAGVPLADEMGGMTGATNQWIQKQLRNYLTKDLGSPADPLLQVEKEHPNLHLPEGSMPQSVGESRGGNTRRNNAYVEGHRKLAGDEPFTPWTLHSDKQLYAMTPEEYTHHLENFYDELAHDKQFAWLGKAPPETKIWGLESPTEDALGFGHVRDYLEAAQKAHSTRAGSLGLYENGMMPREVENAHKMFDAGLTLSSEQVARTSVADAVRKTAQWNKLLEEGMGGPANLDLERGIKAVHKEYPEHGMKWVELGKQEISGDLPKGWSVEPVTAGGKTSYEVLDDQGRMHPEFSSRASSPGEAIKKFSSYYPEFELSTGLNAEGEAMGHCVGGYCDDVASRGTKIYSLRDKNNNPHVTVEVARPLRKISDEESLRNIRQNFPKASEEEIQQKFAQVWAPNIVQIKGKQNAAPVSKYLPFVQDFVKSGNWGHVGDLGNTELARLTEPYQILGSKGEPLGQIPPGFHSLEDVKTQLKAVGYPEQGPGTTLEDYANMILGKGGAGRSRYAHGGSVQAPKFSRKAELLARLNRG